MSLAFLFFKEWITLLFSSLKWWKSSKNNYIDFFCKSFLKIKALLLLSRVCSLCKESSIFYLCFGLGKVFFGFLSPHQTLVRCQVSRKTLLKHVFSDKAMWNFEISNLCLLPKKSEKCGEVSKWHDVRLSFWYTIVLISCGMESIFMLVDGVMLWFSFRMTIMLITHWWVKC